MDNLRKQKILMLIDKNQLTEITPEELSQYDGKNGRPAYIAVNDVVYNVTAYSSWADGSHFDISAGTDATEVFEMCHDHTLLERLQIVGKLVQ